jgi:hypothetical protein
MVRVLVVAAILATATVVIGAPVAAAVPLAAVVGDPGNVLTYVLVDRHAPAVSENFVATGDGASAVTLMASDSRVSLEPQPNDLCTGGGLSLTCTRSGPNGQGIWGTARIVVPPDMPLGLAGTLTASTPGGSSDTVPLWIVDASVGADIQIDTVGAVGLPGQTITVTITVTNHGPSPEPYFGIDNFYLPNAQLLDLQGCSPGTSGGLSLSCLFAPLEVGVPKTITLSIAIFADPVNDWFGSFATEYAFPDPSPSDNHQDFQIRPNLGDTGGGSGSGSGGSGSGGSAGQAAPTASATPTPVASVTPTATAVTGSVDAAAPAGTLRADGAPASSGGGSVWLAAGAAILVVLGAAGTFAGLRLRRRHVLAASAEPVAESQPPADG